jgi:hypothetical protein
MSQDAHLLGLIREMLPYVEELMPATHPGPCGPESMCDGDCMDAAATSSLSWRAKAALADAEDAERVLVDTEPEPVHLPTLEWIRQISRPGESESRGRQLRGVNTGLLYPE